LAMKRADGRRRMIESKLCGKRRPAATDWVRAETAASIEGQYA
jgi:hypothetical protein